MSAFAKDSTATTQKFDNDSLGMLRHDINNQLSNIILAVEQLRYEIPGLSEDCMFYLDTISTSSEKINSLLKSESQEPRDPEN